MENFLKKYKEVVIAAVMLLIAIAWFSYSSNSSNQAAVKECKNECIYDSQYKVWEYRGGANRGLVVDFSDSSREKDGRDFPRQEQCVNHCLNQ